MGATAYIAALFATPNEGNTGTISSIGGRHVYNYVPIYQDVFAKGYW